MFDDVDPGEPRDERPGADQPEFEKLEFLPLDDESPAADGPFSGEALTFELPDIADEPPVTVDPLAAPSGPLEAAAEEPDLGTRTPFELLGSSLFDDFSPDDSLDWAFELETEDGDDLDS